MSEEDLQIAVKRRESKSKGEKERYSHLNSEFQRIARRDKKDFLSNQCKEIEENNRMGKPRDLFKKIRDTKGTFHAKTGSIKDRNVIDLTEAEDIKKRWQEYTEELCILEKVGLKFNIQKTKIMASGPITSWQVDVSGNSVRLNFFSSKITAGDDCSHEIKDAYSLEGKLRPT